MSPSKQRAQALKKAYRQTEQYKQIKREWQDKNKEKLAAQKKEYQRLWHRARRMYPEGLPKGVSAAKAAEQYEELQKEQLERTRKKHIYLANAESRKEDRVYERMDGRLFLAKLKSKVGCQDCGETDPRVLDFDHDDASEKSGSVSHMLKTSLLAALREAVKCTVRCANCHRKRTTEQFDHVTGSDLLRDYDHPLLAHGTVAAVLDAFEAQVFLTPQEDSVPVYQAQDSFEEAFASCVPP